METSTPQMEGSLSPNEELSPGDEDPAGDEDGDEDELGDLDAELEEILEDEPDSGDDEVEPHRQVMPTPDTAAATPGTGFAGDESEAETVDDEDDFGEEGAYGRLPDAGRRLAGDEGDDGGGDDEGALDISDSEMPPDEEGGGPTGAVLGIAGASPGELPQELAARSSREGEAAKRSRRQQEMRAHQNRAAQYFDEQQMERYAHFKRAKITPTNMKKVLDALGLRGVTDNARLSLCGVTKLYVAEVVEAARVAAHRAGDRGALQPRHVHEAYQLMRARHRTFGVPRRPRMFT